MAYTYYMKNLSEVRQKLIDNIRETIPEANVNEGSFIANVFINPFADQLTALWGDMELLKLSQSVITTVGDDLDLFAANYFIIRKQATKATGKLRFYIANSNKPSSQISDYDFPEILEVPLGTQVYSEATYLKDPVYAQTIEPLYYTREALKQLPIDGDTGYRYIEAAAETLDTGNSQNVAAYELSHFEASVNGIQSVTNPFAFSGGVDREDDTALTYRIQLAITGNNIGTKDGYKKYVLDQTNVVNAMVAGAGDEIMFRDGGYLDLNGKYHWGRGGCVDIYIRGSQILESSYVFSVTPSFVKAPQNIILPQQPVTNILSITSNLSGETFVDAANYDVETYSETVDDTITIHTQYCTDILWDFSLTDTFPDLDYYTLPLGYTTAQIERLKVILDNELLDAREYMQNMIYSTDWSTASRRTDDTSKLFDKVIINNNVYKLIARQGSNLDGRVFIMKNDEIYVRAYVQPDYILQHDLNNYAGSMVGEDSIKWLNTAKLLNNDVLTILYNYDYLIQELQAGIQEQKCLTADVIVKKAIEVPLEIIVDIEILNLTTPNTAKKAIATNITELIESGYPLGGSIRRSDIVAAIKKADYVNNVDLNTLKLARKGFGSEDVIKIKDNEYFTIANLVLNITVEDSVIA